MKIFSYFFKNLSTACITLLIVGLGISFILTGKVNSFHFIGIFFVFLSFIVVKVSYFNHYSKVKKLSFFKLFITALLIRLVFIYVFSSFFYYLNGFPFVSDKDDYLYNDAAIKIANFWSVFGIKFNSGIQLSTGFYSGYPNFSAFTMLLFGKGWWAPRIGDAILSSITVVYFARIMDLLYPFKAARLGTTLMLFSPIFITYSSLQLKDTLLIFLVAGVLYHFLLVLNQKVSLRSVIVIIIYFAAMLFVRAATIPPIIIAGLIALLYNNYKARTGGKTFGIIVILFMIVGIVFLWNYLGTLDLLASPETYFQSRYDNVAGENAKAGKSALLSGSHLAFLFSAPLFIVGCIVLPIPLAIKLPDIHYFTNYEYSATIFLMALTPFYAVALYNWYKNKKVHRELIFIIAFYFIYKIGQAFSLSIFSLRQSLPGILCMYIILPFFFLYKPKQLVLRIFLCLDVLAILAFAIVRLSTRNQL